jgi:hypothetical protein
MTVFCFRFSVFCKGKEKPSPNNGGYQPEFPELTMPYPRILLPEA